MHDFASLIFGKPLINVTIEDLEAYFRRPQIETDKLEFKAYPAGMGEGAAGEFEKKVLRSIVGFLNSEGGILVLGAPKGDRTGAGGKEAFQGDLVPTDIRHEKDAFIAKIANKVVPSPRGILFCRLATKDQRHVYLLEIPPSDYAPHQVDNIYYMRLDGQTVPAPHHYIEALFKKVTFPKLEGYLKIEGWSYENSKHIRLKCCIIFRNQSPFQNDYNLQYRLISNTGLILREGKSYLHMNTAIAEGTDYEKKNVADTVYFRNYIYEPFDIVLGWDSLRSLDYRFNLVVIFGAKMSPMRQSRYVLNFTITEPTRKQDVIIQKEENLYFHELGVDHLSDMEDLDHLLYCD